MHSQRIYLLNIQSIQIADCVCFRRNVILFGMIREDLALREIEKVQVRESKKESQENESKLSSKKL